MVLACCLLTSGPAVALQVPAGPPVERPSHLLADPFSRYESLDLAEAHARAVSRFNLYAAVDVAYTGMRMAGTLNYFMSNAGPGDYNYNPGALGYLLHRGAWRHNFFEVTLMAGTPRSTWLRNKSGIPSLENVRNEDGYVGFMNAMLAGSVQNFGAADGTLGELFSGVVSTNDGSCLDHSSYQAGGLNVGVPLLAGSNCSETWGRIGWAGERPVSAEAWEDLFHQRGSGFTFNWWDVPDSHQGTGVLGDFQTFGQITDFYRERLEEYGAVIPGGVGEPVKDGYPLGLEIDFEAYSFSLPTVANAVVWQARVTNRSDRIYPGGIDYDSLYLGISPQPSNFIQQTATYYEPATGSVRWVNNGVNPGCNGADWPYCDTGAERGFYWGASQMMVLNSPIGDLRNKHFSDPASPFHDPDHPAAGDTITFNHGHPCGYGACTGTTILTGSARRSFGMLSSTEVNVLDGRDPEDLTAEEYWNVFRSKDYPDRSGGFNRYVPGDWSYSNRPPGAPEGPDTLYLAGCHGSGAPADACVATWSDTMPGGQSNYFGNVQVVSVGPFPLRVGESVPLTLAIMATPDSMSAEQIQAAVTDLYMDFWLGPEAPPAPEILATNVSSGGVRDSEVTIHLGNEAERWEDPFLDDFHTKLVNASDGTGLAALRDLNPWLADSIRARSVNNVAELHIYRSCNAGASWTSTADCIGNPATNVDGLPVDNAWQPAAILQAGGEGRLPGSWTDRQVRSGVEYTYALAVRSRGARWTVLEQAAGGGVQPGTLELAPSLLAPLSASVSEPHVARVYVPISDQAGSTPAGVQLPAEGQKGPALVPFNNLSVQLVGQPRTAGGYRIVFGNRFVITEGTEATSVVMERDGRESLFRAPFSGATTINHHSGTYNVETVGGATVTTIDDALGIVLVRHSDGAPLLVSTDLRGGGGSTPARFMTRDDFPGFLLDVDNSRAGDFHGAFYLDQHGDSVGGAIEPDLVWRERSAVRLGQLDVPGACGTGEYEFRWEDRPFGPDAPVEIDFDSPEATGRAMSETLSKRRVGSRTVMPEPRVFEDILRPAIQEEFSTAGFDDAAAVAAESLATDDLVVVDLPFTIHNLSFQRPVEAVMLRREVRARLVALAQGLDAEGVAARERAAHEITLGSGTDTQSRVAVPEDVWIPGDPLYLLEEVEGEPVVTWRGVELACGSPRPTCNPVRGPGASAYVEPQPGFSYRVRHYVPFSVESEFVVAVRPAKVAEAGTITRESLDDILVVPNPYMVRSIHEQGGSRESALYFVNMPPRGKVRIYTVAGHFVQQIQWTPEDLVALDGSVAQRTRPSGDLRWDMRTREGNDIAAGLYVFVVEAGGHRKMGRFVVIR